MLHTTILYNQCAYKTERKTKKEVRKREGGEDN